MDFHSQTSRVDQASDDFISIRWLAEWDSKASTRLADYHAAYLRLVQA